MLFNLWTIFNFFVWVFLFALISGRKHLLATFLSLEGVMLCLFSTLAVHSSMWLTNYAFILGFLTFVACEGALALSILVVGIRWWGQDKILSLNMLLG